MTRAHIPTPKPANPDAAQYFAVTPVLAKSYNHPAYSARTVNAILNGKMEPVTIQAPVGWRDEAVATVAEKYLRRADVPNHTIEDPATPATIPPSLRPRIPAPDATFGPETSIHQVLHRLAGAWAYHALTLGYLTPEDAEVFYREALLSLELQMASPNSPQWFNTGLAWAYGIKGDGGTLWHADPSNPFAATLCDDAYTHPQASACFILDVSDDLVRAGGIMDLWKREAIIFKGGSGAGVNVSPIRAEGERLSGGGKSSGVMGFLRIGDRAAGAIKSGGRTRRAAKMLCMDADHPDILDFIRLKAREEHKVAALATGSHKTRAAVAAIHDAIIAHGHPSPQSLHALDEARIQGIPAGLVAQAVLAAQQGFCLLPDEMGTDWRSEAYYTVDGQNANNTVRLPHAFMQALEDDSSWTLTGRVDPSVNRTLPARELWDAIATAAWASADPGLHFSGTIDEWHTCPEDGPITASNPCVTGDTLVLCWDHETRTTYEKPIAEMCDGPQTIFVDHAPREIGPAFKTGTKEVLRITFESGNHLRVTPDHLVTLWDPHHMRDIPAREIECGMLLCTDQISQVERVASITPEAEPQDVYDLTEPQTSHFIANGIRVHNCSEYLFVNNTACNLASINLLKCLRINPDNGKREMHAPLLQHLALLWTMILDITVGMAGYPTPELATNSARYRTLGLGMANLGAVLMQSGLPYGSPEGLALGRALAAIINATAYNTSARLAASLAPHDAYEANKTHALRVLHNHRAAALRDLRASQDALRTDSLITSLGLYPRSGSDADPQEYQGLTITPPTLRTDNPHTCDLYQRALEIYARAYHFASIHGLRNAQLTVCAPTGTISFQMGCDTTGCEPDFALVRMKTYAGGGHRTLVTQGIGAALASLGWCEEDIDAAILAIEARGAFYHADPFPEGHQSDLTPDDIYHAAQVLACACAADDRVVTLKWTDHVAMLAALQPHTSGALSKTINLPQTATRLHIAEAYHLSYRLGLKAVAVYRDGSKFSQPLNLPDAAQPKTDAPKTDAPKVSETPKPEREYLGIATNPPLSPVQASRMTLPALAESVRVKATLAGHSLYLHTGEYEDGRLGEVFVTMGGQGGDMGAWIGAWAQSVSVSLQHGVPFAALARSFLRHAANPAGFVHGLASIPALAHIRTASSPMDLIFQILAAFYDDDGMRRDPKPHQDSGSPVVHFTSRVTLADGTHATIEGGVIQAPPKTPAPPPTPSEAPAPTPSVKPKGGGDLCHNCGNFALQWSGNRCQVCSVCHETTGCS